MQYFIIFLIFITQPIFGLAQNNPKNTPVKEEWKIFTDSATNFHLQYPESWYLKLTNEKTVFVLKSPEENREDAFLENINLIVKILPEGTKLNLEAVAAASVKSLKDKYPDFTLQTSAKTIWLNKDAWELTYSITNNGSSSSLIQKMLFFNTHFFICTYTAQAGKKDIYLPLAKEIFSKMTIK